MEQGRIIKLIGGLYTVLDDNGKTHVLKPRGLFRHEKQNPRVGDLVAFDTDLIQEVITRKNLLLRPSIANVDQAFIINGCVNPAFSFFLLDRFLVHTEKAGIDAVIVVNKIDLLSEDKLRRLRDDLLYYERYYDVIYVSAKDPKSLEPLRHRFSDKVNVFAGQTGSGKSSILNALNPDLSLKTQPISKALGRGKHTTRHSELIPFENGFVADTPGFSKLDFEGIVPEDLPEYYKDFFERSALCKFRGCQHINEPGCAVKKAVKDNEVPRNRYENYLRIHEEISQTKIRY